MKREFYLILPDIRSCHNVGAMFRTADACGVTKLFLVGYTPDPPRPQIDKVSLGAEKWMKWEHRKDLKVLVRSLKKNGVVIVGLEKTTASVKIERLTFVPTFGSELRSRSSGRGKDQKINNNIALIVGNEVGGISEEILKMCDVVVHIPMCGKKESLNVSIAAGIAMYVISQKSLK